MVRLTILGDVDLRTDDGTTIASVLSQPRRFALLVYLALEGRGGGVQRDRLLGVFWADLPQDNARQALRTALHFLRRSLGRSALVSHGELVSLDPERVGCDAVDLLAALEADAAESALRLYEGDLLPGFYLDGGPVEFERWLDDVRASLRRETAEAAWRLAGTQEQSGNPAGAGAWARKAAALSQDDETAARRAIALLGRIGDRAGALAVYDDLARRLRTEFDATPSPETEAAIARVRDTDPALAPSPAVGPVARVASGWPGSPGSPRSPYASAPSQRSDASEGSDDAVPGMAPGEAAGPAGGEPAGREPARRPLRTLVSPIVTLVLVAAFYSLWGLNRVEPAWTQPRDVRPVLRVEPLRDFSPEGEGADLAGALTMELAGLLSQTDALQVMALTEAAPVRTAAGNDPLYVLRGGLLRSDSTTRVTAVLMDGSSGATLDRITLERPVAGPGATVDELVEALGAEVRRKVGRAVEDHLRRAEARDTRALELVRSALGDAEVADSLRTLGAREAAAGAYAAADSQLARAQAAAPRWPEPPLQRASLALDRIWLHVGAHHDVDSLELILEEGLERAEAALAIAPDDPAALEVAGRLHYWIGLTQQQDPERATRAGERAEDYLRRATHLDPGLPRAWDLLSTIEESRGDFGAANLSARRAYRADAYLGNAMNVLLRLFSSSLEIGDTAAARQWCTEIEERGSGAYMGGICRLELRAWQPPRPDFGPDSVASLIQSSAEGHAHRRQVLDLMGAVVLARAGHTAEADALLRRGRSAAVVDITLPMYEAWALLALGRREEAVELLARTVARFPASAGRLLSSRRFDPVRDDPRLRGGAPGL